MKSIAKYVYPPDYADLFIFKMKKSEQEGTELASRFPGEVLTLLDRVIAADQQYPPYDLSSVLSMIAEAKPQLRQDTKWLRLRKLADVG